MVRHKRSHTKHPQLRIDRVKELQAEGKNWPSIAAAINKEDGVELSVHSVKGIYYHNKDKPVEDKPDIGGMVLAKAAEIIREGQKRPEKITADEWLDVLSKAQGVRDAVSMTELMAKVSIDTEFPIALCFTSDWHIGSPSMNIGAFKSDLDVIRGDPRFYVCIGGDRTDNFQKSFNDASAPMNTLAPPQLQKLAMESILESIEDKVIAMVGGNHDAMGKKMSGEDGDYWILRNFKFSYLPHGGLLRLTVGDVQYKILWKHSYRFKSSLNEFNSHHRMSEILCPDSDINVQEHLHSPGIEMIEKGEFDNKYTQVNIKTGTYKENDGFSLDHFKAGRIGPQVVVLWPNEKRVTAFHGKHALKDARGFLNGIKEIEVA